MFFLNFCSYIHLVYTNFIQAIMELKQGVFLENIFIITIVHTAKHHSLHPLYDPSLPCVNSPLEINGSELWSAPFWISLLLKRF